MNKLFQLIMLLAVVINCSFQIANYDLNRKSKSNYLVTQQEEPQKCLVDKDLTK